jgi:thiosulfate dehydrogenase
VTLSEARHGSWVAIGSFSTHLCASRELLLYINGEGTRFAAARKSLGVCMGKFVLGIVLTVAVVLLIVFGLALLGFLPTKANRQPPDWERHFAMSALDNSVDRYAPRVDNPLPPTDENLIAGMKIYTMNCAGCHGGIDRKPADFGRSFYPPAPNLILEPDTDPEWHIFYIIRNGVRYTGMASWDKMLSESDLWKVTAFLSRIEKLPPAVQDYWKQAGGAMPEQGTAEQGAGEKHEHH